MRNAAGTAGYKGQEPVIPVRPQPPVREALRQAAEAAGRTMVKESELRLAASVEGGHFDLFADWPPAYRARFRSLGNLVAIVAARATRAAGKEQTPADLLPAMRVAMEKVFASLGADGAPSENDKFFAMIGQQVAGEIELAEMLGPNLTGEMAALEQFARAWGLTGGDGETSA